jgi:hypothetical protein
VSAEQASSVVLQQGSGSSVIAVSSDTRKGLQTWAVQIGRSNGEILTGYLDLHSGIVVDWSVQQGPTSTASAASTPSHGEEGTETTNRPHSQDHGGSGSGGGQSEDD